jgi:hypothetical protein
MLAGLLVLLSSMRPFSMIPTHKHEGPGKGKASAEMHAWGPGIAG